MITMDTKQYIQVTLYSVLAIIIVVINSFSLIILCWSKKLRSKPSVVLLVNLIATHLIQGSVVMPIYALRKGKNYPVSWYPVVCDIWRLSYMLTFYGTCINVLLIALDRFVATKYFLKYTGQFKHKHFLAAVGCGWLYVLLLCLIPFIPIKKSISLKWPFYCNYNQPAEWSSFMLIFNTVVPYFIVIVIYMYITHRLKVSTNVIYKNNNDYIRKQNNLSPDDDFPDDPTETRDRAQVSSFSSQDSSCVIIPVHSPMSKKRNSVFYKKVNQLTFRIIFIYGITWAPSIVYYSIVTMTPNIFSSEYYVSLEEMIITFIMKYITFFNAAAAPILYCYNHGDFRKEAKRFFKNIRKVQIKNIYQIRS